MATVSVPNPQTWGFAQLWFSIPMARTGSGPGFLTRSAEVSIQNHHSTRHVFDPSAGVSHVQDLKQYNCMRAHILQCIKKKSDQDGFVALQFVVNSANERYKSHPLFPKGAFSDLEAFFCVCVFRAFNRAVFVFFAVQVRFPRSQYPSLSRCHPIRPWNRLIFFGASFCMTKPR